MKNGFLICLLLLVVESLSTSLLARQHDTIIADIEQLKLEAGKVFEDTITSLEKPIVIEEEYIGIKNIEVPFKPNSTKSVIYSTIFPGLGQIYNRKYWKLPIVYGGFLGVMYGVTWNGRYYDDYSRAYKDLYSGSGTSYKDFIPSSVDIDNVGERERWLGKLRRQKDFYRRNRDLAIIAGVALYALCIIDAYVDAQLYDFDMSEDLSMHIEPVIWTPTPVSKTTVGVKCKITF